MKATNKNQDNWVNEKNQKAMESNSSNKRNATAGHDPNKRGENKK